MVRRFRLLALGALLLVLASASAPSATASDAKLQTDDLVLRINHERVSAGLLPLSRAPELDTAAQAHSADMVAHNYLDHTGSDGSGPQQRAEQAGYKVPPQSGWIVVEVISAISGDAQGPVSWWLNDSEQHRSVLLNPRWREIGAGYAEGGEYGYYWTADFGCRPGVLPLVTLDGRAYASTEECGDPRSEAALTAIAAMTMTPVATLPAPTLVLTPSPQPLGPTVLGPTPVTAALEPTSAPTGLGPAPAPAALEPTSVTAVFGPTPVRTALGPTPVQTVSPPTPDPAGSPPLTLAVSSEVAAAGDSVNVRWSGLSTPRATDWIGLYRPGDGDRAYMSWTYVGCATIPLDARAFGSCNLTLPRALPHAVYEFRLFRDNDYTRLRVSPPIQVN